MYKHVMNWGILVGMIFGLSVGAFLSPTLAEEENPTVIPTDKSTNKEIPW